MFVAYDGLLGIDGIEDRQAYLLQHAANGDNASVDDLGNAALRQAFAP